MDITTNNTLFCNKCGRPIKSGWLEFQGMKICGVCQWEAANGYRSKEQHWIYDLNGHEYPRFYE